MKMAAKCQKKNIYIYVVTGLAQNGTEYIHMYVFHTYVCISIYSSCVCVWPTVNTLSGST